HLDKLYFVGYSINSKAFRVFNNRTKIVEETIHITFLENKPNVARSRPTWLLDIDTLIKSMNYKPVVARNQSNGSAGKAKVETVPEKDYILLPLWTQDPLLSSSSKDSLEDNAVDENIVYGCANDVNMPNLKEIIYLDDDDEVGEEADMTNLDTNIFRAIGTKWIYRNKKDKRGIMIRNKARLVVQGYTQEEGIDYDEVFALIPRIEAIRLFLAYASFKDFVMYQMDVKSAFLYGKIKEEVYVYQPLRFKDPKFYDKVYKVEKALYGLHQAPRAWYETLSTYLLDNRFHRGQIDKTLLIKRFKSDILLVQVYIDDIIFGSTRNEMCIEFEKMMHKKFSMNSIGELTFFLGLKVTKKLLGLNNVLILYMWMLFSFGVDAAKDFKDIL
nr:retrovirus-related Pol polyprotein from transposon TNT 1-94 [Tanacetum cinerariifolium]